MRVNMFMEFNPGCWRIQGCLSYSLSVITNIVLVQVREGVFIVHHSKNVVTMKKCTDRETEFPDQTSQKEIRGHLNANWILDSNTKCHHIAGNCDSYNNRKQTTTPHSRLFLQSSRIRDSRFYRKKKSAKAWYGQIFINWLGCMVVPLLKTGSLVLLREGVGDRLRVHQNALDARNFGKSMTERERTK